MEPNTTNEASENLPVAERGVDEPAAGLAADGAEALPIDAASAALHEAERLLDEQKDKYVRLFAEFENFRKRSIKERLDAEAKGMSALMLSLLDSLDDLGRVAHFDPSTTAAQAIAEGVALVEKKMLKSLADLGLSVVNPDGQKFDPALHEALSATPAASADEDERVAQVFQVGYTFNGQLLRPARVVVKQWNG